MYCRNTVLIVSELLFSQRQLMGVCLCERESRVMEVCGDERETVYVGCSAGAISQEDSDDQSATDRQLSDVEVYSAHKLPSSQHLLDCHLI